MSDLYDTDTYTWAMRQADALRRRSANEVDWDNVAEEIESVGRTEARELKSRYIVLLAHLLKWQAQQDQRGSSWQITIKTQRSQIRKHIEANPGLKQRRGELFAEAYEEAVADAVVETKLPVDAFPETNPFTLAQAMDDGFWPEG